MSSLEARIAGLDRCRTELAERLKGVDRAGQPRPLHGFESLLRDLQKTSRRTLRQRKRMDPVVWAERYLYIPPDTSPTNPGKLRLTEFQKQQLRTMLAPTTRFYVQPKSVQVGYSLVSAVAIFYVIAHLGLPAAYVTRSDEEVDRWMKTYFHPMLKERQNKVLTRILRTPKQGDDKDTIHEKIFLNRARFLARTAASDAVGNADLQSFG